MPKVMSDLTWPRVASELLVLADSRMHDFCQLNDIDAPPINLVDAVNWHFDPCAFYRPEGSRMPRWYTWGINICLHRCGRPCDDGPGRNWSWPGGVTDRTVYGVVAHELAHHCDWTAGQLKGTYWSEYGQSVMVESGEPATTSYGETNPSEWFAEAFRLYITNPGLLKALRPRTWVTLNRRWRHVGTLDWREVLGDDCPRKVLKSLHNKGAR